MSNLLWKPLDEPVMLLANSGFGWLAKETQAAHCEVLLLQPYPVAWIFLKPQDFKHQNHNFSVGYWITNMIKPSFPKVLSLLNIKGLLLP